MDEYFEILQKAPDPPHLALFCNFLSDFVPSSLIIRNLDNCLSNVHLPEADCTIFTCWWLLMVDDVTINFTSIYIKLSFWQIKSKINSKCCNQRSTKYSFNRKTWVSESANCQWLLLNVTLLGTVLLRSFRSFLVESEGHVLCAQIYRYKNRRNPCYLTTHKLAVEAEKDKVTKCTSFLSVSWQFCY